MKISISRRGLATKTVLYHGTSSKFLRTILKKGLEAAPKQRVWQDDKDRNSRNLSRKALDGVYATTNLMTAMSASTNATQRFGGNPIIIIIEGQVRSGFHDEDSVRYAVQNAFSSVTGDTSANRIGEFYAQILVDKYRMQHYQSKWYAEAKQHFVDNVLASFKYDKMPPKVEPAMAKLLPIILDAMVQRAFFYGVEENKEKPYYGPFEGLSRFFDRVGVIYEADGYGKFRDPYAHESYKDGVPDWFLPKDQAVTIKKEDIWGDPAKADDTYLSLLDRITRLLRSNLPEVMKDAFSFSMRFPTDVKFRGANRIVAILEDSNRWSDDKEVRNGKTVSKIQVHYGKPPKDFERQYTERVSGRDSIVEFVR